MNVRDSGHHQVVRAQADRERILLRGVASIALLSLILPIANLRADAPLEQFDAYVLRTMQDWQVPGLAVAVVKDDEVVHAKGYGIREIGKPDVVDADTLFAIGSNTKAFTVTALGMLVQEGRLSWDDPVIKHMPNLQLYDPYVTRELMIRDLLCHRAGFATWGGDLVGWGSTYNREELIRRLRYLKPVSSLRSRFGYSNCMFLVAGQVIPQVADTSWDDFVKERIFKPLGMTRTNTSVRDLGRLDNVASPHTSVDNKVVVIPYVNIDNHGPAGSINSSVANMARWIRLQLGNGTYENKQLVDPSVIQEARTPHTIIPSTSQRRRMPRSKLLTAYGLGWGLSDYDGRLHVSHGGGVDGMLSRVALIPEENLGVVVLSNYDEHRLYAALAYRVLDAYLGLPAHDWSTELLEQAKESKARQEEAKKTRLADRATGTKPSRHLQQYCGRFKNDHYGEASIAERNGKLILRLSAHPNTPGDLEHWHYDTFLCRWRNPVFGESMIPFALDERGSITSFRVSVRPDWIDPVEYEFGRVADGRDSPKAP